MMAGCGNKEEEAQALPSPTAEQIQSGRAPAAAPAAAPVQAIQ